MFTLARTRTITVETLPSLQRVKIRILEYSFANVLNIVCELHELCPDMSLGKCS